jgi:hypothetical protein
VKTYSPERREALVRRMMAPETRWFRRWPERRGLPNRRCTRGADRRKDKGWPCRAMGRIPKDGLPSLEHHIVNVPFYVPGEHPKYQDADSAFIQKVKRYLMKINPALKDDDFVQVHASRYRFAQPICEPGYLDRLPPIQLPVKGLFVADTSYYYSDDRGISERINLSRKMAKML